MSWYANELLNDQQQLQVNHDITKVCLISKTHFTKQPFIKFRSYKVFCKNYLKNVHYTEQKNSSVNSALKVTKCSIILRQFER